MTPVSKLRSLIKSYRNSVAVYHYKKKLKNNRDLYQLVEEFNRNNVLEMHYAQNKCAEKNVQLHLGIQLAELIVSVKDRLKEGYMLERFLDAGDSDGIILRSLGVENGISLNINKDCVAQIKKNGGVAVRGDVEHLPFKDECFDSAICFETIEHLQNPVRGLQELARVSSRIFLSIPWMERTRVNDTGRGHIFEFSHEDFNKILTHTNLKAKYYKEISIFPRMFNPLHYLIMRLSYFRSFFPKLQFYELRREKS